MSVRGEHDAGLVSGGAVAPPAHRPFGPLSPFFFFFIPRFLLPRLCWTLTQPGSFDGDVRRIRLPRHTGQWRREGRKKKNNTGAHRASSPASGCCLPATNAPTCGAFKVIFSTAFVVIKIIGNCALLWGGYNAFIYIFVLEWAVHRIVWGSPQGPRRPTTHTHTHAK